MEQLLEQHKDDTAEVISKRFDEQLEQVGGGHVLVGCSRAAGQKDSRASRAHAGHWHSVMFGA